MTSATTKTPRSWRQRRRTASTRARRTLTRLRTPVSFFSFLAFDTFPSFTLPARQPSRANNTTEDERTIANKLEREEKREKEDDDKLSEEDRLRKIDATLPAKLHGNEPSKGAKLDQELREEEQAELERKGKA